MKIIATLTITSLFLITGCEPSNISECKQSAAKMPTERGVTVAVRDCENKFPPPLADFTPISPAPVVTLEMAAAQISKAYPYLETPDGERALQLIILERDTQISRGVEPAQALLSAAQKIAPDLEPFSYKK